jgi:hypothetical protein
VKLKMNVQTAVQYGAKGNLGAVTVRAVDCSGNASSPEKDYEVTMKPAASNPDDPSISAKVTCRGSNRARMQQGQATFYDVQLKSDSQGLFSLVAYCKSRSVVCVRMHMPCSIWKPQPHPISDDCTLFPFEVWSFQPPCSTQGILICCSSMSCLL